MNISTYESPDDEARRLERYKERRVRDAKEAIELGMEPDFQLKVMAKYVHGKLRDWHAND